MHSAAINRRFRGGHSADDSLQHHSSAIARVLVALVTIATITVYVLAIRWLMKHSSGSRVSLIWGFSRGDRRSIIRTVRPGKSSDDPLTRYIGAGLAGKIVKQRTQAIVVLAIVCVGLIIWTIVGWRDNYSQAERPLFLLVLMVVAFLRNRQALNGACKYLNTANRTIGQQQHPGQARWLVIFDLAAHADSGLPTSGALNNRRGRSARRGARCRNDWIGVHQGPTGRVVAGGE